MKVTVENKKGLNKDLKILKLLKKDYLDGNLKASKNPIHTKLKMVFLYLKKI